MSKALQEALKLIDSKILTESVEKSITEAFEDAVKNEVESKVTELKESFDSNLDAVISDKLQTLKESFEKQVDDRAKELNEDHNKKLVESVDTYLDEVKDKWLNENKISMQAESDVAKAEAILERFAEFAKDFGVDLHGITSVDMDAKKLLDESVEEKAKLKEEILELKKEKAIKEAVEGLTVKQADKLQTLSESIVTKDIDKFKEQLNTFKETLIEGVVPKEKPSDKKDKSFKLEY